MYKIRPYLKYIFLFILFLVFNIFVISLCGDEIWNYGFSYNIHKGLIPYKDFNMVITPFFPFLMSIPFNLFGTNILVFDIFQSFILVILSYYIFKMLGNRGWFCLLFLFIPTVVTFPSYNVFLLLLFAFLIYLEDKEVKNNYLIGFVLGLTLLTKQSVGVCLLLPSLYYIKNKDVILKRFVGFLIPISVFIVYLIFTDSYIEFIDLCVLGLLDFSKNSNGFNLFAFLSLILIIYIIKSIIKSPRSIKNYYLLSFFSIVLPLFDLYHFQIFFVAFLFIVLPNCKRDYFNYKLLMIGIVLNVFFVSMYYDLKSHHYIYPNNINNFNYKFINDNEVSFTLEVNKFLKDNASKKVVFLCTDSYYFKLINDWKIGWLDLVNYGNWGYHGSKKLMSEIKNNDQDTIYIINRDEIDTKGNQTDKDAVRYVLKHGKKIETIRIYDMYVLDKNN